MTVFFSFLHHFSYKTKFLKPQSGLAFEFIFYILKKKKDFRNVQSKKNIKKFILEAPFGLQEASELKNNTQLPKYIKFDCFESEI